MELNRPDVVSEVTAAFTAYEQALVAGDVAAMSAAFWEHDEVVRFGVADHQFSAADLRRWRAAQPPLPPGRRLFDTRITTFGADLAVVTTRFSYADSSEAGRQSQTWVRLPVGWRIVSAHVSQPASAPGPAPIANLQPR